MCYYKVVHYYAVTAELIQVKASAFSMWVKVLIFIIFMQVGLSGAII